MIFYVQPNNSLEKKGRKYKKNESREKKMIKENAKFEIFKRIDQLHRLHFVTRS